MIPSRLTRIDPLLLVMGFVPSRAATGQFSRAPKDDLDRELGGRTNAPPEVPANRAPAGKKVLRQAAIDDRNGRVLLYVQQRNRDPPGQESASLRMDGQRG
jgi:hypothetical protein